MCYPRIKELRGTLGMTQAEAVRFLNVHPSTYARYENGKREIPPHLAVLLCKYYGVSLDYLAGLCDRKQ